MKASKAVFSSGNKDPERQEGPEEVVLDIPDLGAGGRGRQDVIYFIQGGGLGIVPLWIGDAGHDPAHRQYAGGYFTIGWTTL